MIAVAAARADWAVGFADETWWSRVARPPLHAWSDAGPARLATLAVAADPEPKALACYGPLLRRQATEELWLRFVDGRPVSAVTEQFLAWCCARAAATGVTTLALIWDNAAWQVSRAVRAWIQAHNAQTHRAGGVRIVPCLLPIKSSWLNPIAPKWLYGKRHIVEPARLLSAREVEERVCAAFGSPLADHLVVPQEVV